MGQSRGGKELATQAHYTAAYHTSTNMAPTPTWTETNFNLPYDFL